MYVSDTKAFKIIMMQVKCDHYAATCWLIMMDLSTNSQVIKCTLDFPYRIYTALIGVLTSNL